MFLTSPFIDQVSMTGLRSQRSMKRGSTPTPVCSEFRLFSREAITRFDRWISEILLQLNLIRALAS